MCCLKYSTVCVLSVSSVLTLLCCLAEYFPHVELPQQHHNLRPGVDQSGVSLSVCSYRVRGLLSESLSPHSLSPLSTPADISLAAKTPASWAAESSR